MNEPQLLIEYKPVQVSRLPYRHMTPLLQQEVNRPTVSQRQKEHLDLVAEGIIVPVLAKAFLRSSKRKAKEPFAAYRRGLTNAKKALKVYMKHGELAMVQINKNTMEIV